MTKIDNMILGDLIIELEHVKVWIVSSSRRLLGCMQLTDFMSNIEVMRKEVMYMQAIEQRIKELTEKKDG